MKTSDVSSNRPVQNNDPGSKPEAKKPQKDFKEVLDQPGGKKLIATKKKAFSPLNQEKNVKPDKLHSQTSEHKRVSGKGEREEVGESELGEGKSKKSSLHPEEGQVQPNIMQTGQGGVQTAMTAEKAGAPKGLSLEQLQSIVQKCHVGINEQGKPEMNFQIQTHHLGPMDLKVSADGDKIKIDFVTEDINAKEAIKENLNELSNMLREKGLTLGQTNFTTRDQDQNEKQQKQQEEAWEGPAYSDSGRPKKGFSL